MISLTIRTFFLRTFLKRLFRKTLEELSKMCSGDILKALYFIFWSIPSLFYLEFAGDVN